MNEAVAKLLDLLVYEILWPIVEEKVKKHGPTLVKATSEQLRIFAEKALSMLTKEGRLNTMRLIADFQSEFGFQLTGVQRGKFLEFIEKMEALYQGNLGGLIGKKSMTEDLPPKLTSPEPTMVRADAPAQSTDGIPVSDFARQSVAQNDPLAWTSQSYALPADPFCPHCGGLILSHESGCQSCKPVASTAVAGGTSQLLQDPFCPQCGGVILIGQTNCPACGALRAKVPLPGHLSTDFSSGTGIGFFRTNPARLHSSAPPLRETAWGRFFDPTVAEFQSIYAQVAKSPWIEQNRDHRAKISKMVFQYFSNIPDVGAHAEPVTVGPMRIGFLAGLAVAHRVIAAAVSSVAPPSSGSSDYMVNRKTITETLLSILGHVQGHQRAFTSKAGHDLFASFWSDAETGKLDLGCAQAIAHAMHAHVIAHEIGHHLHGHTQQEGGETPDTSRMDERIVDSFALNVMQSMPNKDFSHLGSVLSILTLVALGQDPKKENDSHPANKERLELVFKEREGSNLTAQRFGITEQLCKTVIKTMTQAST